MVSIIIPSRNQADLLANCVRSIEEKTDYPNIEIIVVNNNSTEPEAIALLRNLEDRGVAVLNYPGGFNYSAICNFASRAASGEYLCFLNNDTEVSSRDWLSSMVDHASQPRTGVVGALLNYPDNSIQHIGIALGYTGVAGHPYRGSILDEKTPKHCFQVSAVTFACAVIAADKYRIVGGLDEDFPYGFNDVDFCIRAAQNSLENVLCVRAQLLHYESRSRPKTLSWAGYSQAKQDVMRMLRKHKGNFKDSFF